MAFAWNTSIETNLGWRFPEELHNPPKWTPFCIESCRYFTFEAADYPLLCICFKSGIQLEVSPMTVITDLDIPACDVCPGMEVTSYSGDYYGGVINNSLINTGSTRAYMLGVLYAQGWHPDHSYLMTSAQSSLTGRSLHMHTENRVYRYGKRGYIPEDVKKYHIEMPDWDSIKEQLFVDTSLKCVLQLSESQICAFVRGLIDSPVSAKLDEHVFKVPVYSPSLALAVRHACAIPYKDGSSLIIQDGISGYCEGNFYAAKKQTIFRDTVTDVISTGVQSACDFRSWGIQHMLCNGIHIDVGGQ